MTDTPATADALSPADRAATGRGHQMTEHDPMCLSQEFLPADLTRLCDCERVRAIRADEKAQHLSIPIIEFIARRSIDGYRDAFRAWVMTLDDSQKTRCQFGESQPCTCGEMVATILARLGGSSE